MVRLFPDIEGAPKETDTCFSKFLGDKFYRAVAVPFCRYFNTAVASLNLGIVLPIGRICNKIDRAVSGEEAPKSTFLIIITALLAFTEIKSQCYVGFPFRTHPKAVMVSVTCVVFFGFVSGVELVILAAGFDRHSVYAIIARFGRMASLCILVISLAALFYF